MRESVLYQYSDWSLGGRKESRNDDNLDRLVSDVLYTCPLMDFANLYSSGESGDLGSHCSVFQFRFSHRPSSSPWPVWAGAMRGDELQYVFGRPLNKSLGYDDSEVELSKDMMSSWANFVHTGSVKTNI